MSSPGRAEGRPREAWLEQDPHCSYIKEWMDRLNQLTRCGTFLMDSAILEFGYRQGLRNHPFLPALEDAEHAWAEGEQFKKTSVVVHLPQVGARVLKHCSRREVPTLRQHGWSGLGLWSVLAQKVLVQAIRSMCSPGGVCDLSGHPGNASGCLSSSSC